jgi:sigma-B regulation protein RsbU (phosphoserine phosphatase)
MIDSENNKIKRNLAALVDFSRVINSSLDLDFILNNILLTCLGKFLATKGFVALNTEGKIKIKSFKGITEETIKNFPKLSAYENFIESTELKSFFDENKIVTTEKINSSDGCIGIVCLGEKLNKTPFSEDDKEFLRTILNISATAIQNSIVVNELKKVNRVLDLRIQRLNSLFELSKEFGLLTEPSSVAKLLVYSVIGQFLVSKFAVVIYENSSLQIVETKFPRTELYLALKGCHCSEIEIPLKKSEIEKNYKKLFDLEVELIVPMQIQGKTRGVIILGKRINNLEFSDSDIEFISSVGSLAIISLENIHLFKEALAKQKMEEELELARGIQKNLLPSIIPHFEKFDIAANSITSQQVGGDYYDLIKLSDYSLCIAIGDVSGKCVPAALLMANLQAFLKTTVKHGMNISEATALINDLISENTSDGRFITFFWGILNENNLTLNYVNAGHNPPLLIRNGKIIKLTKGGIILGVMKTVVPYESETVQLEKNDVIIFFTDGITEAKNLKDEEFSDKSLEELALSLASSSSTNILNSIQREVHKFASGTVQSDDLTLLILKVL